MHFYNYNYQMIKCDQYLFVVICASQVVLTSFAIAAWLVFCHYWQYNWSIFII